MNFFLYVDNRLDDSMYHGVVDTFLEHPVLVNRNVTTGQLFFVGQGSVSFIDSVIRLLDFL